MPHTTPSTHPAMRFPIPLTDIIAFAFANDAVRADATDEANAALHRRVFTVARHELARWTPEEVLGYVLLRQSMSGSGGWGVGGRSEEEDEDEDEEGSGYEADVDDDEEEVEEVGEESVEAEAEAEAEEKIVEDAQKTAPFEEDSCGFIHCKGYCRFYPD